MKILPLAFILVHVAFIAAEPAPKIEDTQRVQSKASLDAYPSHDRHEHFAENDDMHDEEHHYDRRRFRHKDDEEDHHVSDLLKRAIGIGSSSECIEVLNDITGFPDETKAIDYIVTLTGVKERSNAYEFLKKCRGSRSYRFIIEFLLNLEEKSNISVIIELLQAMTNEKNVIKAFNDLRRLTGHADFDGIFETLEKIAGEKNPHEICHYFKHVANTNGVEGVKLEILKLTGGLGASEFPKVLKELQREVDIKGAFNLLISATRTAGVSKASACRIVRDVSSAIAALYNRYIYMHSNTEIDFYAIARFPRVLGTLDGTHIRIQSPCSQIGEEFRNRKGYFSLNIQAVCNANLQFMNVVARWPGSAHDATIFNNSELRAQCESGIFGNKWLLGDSAYPLKPYLLTPLLNPRTRGEQLYNEAHIRTRNTIERCFGVWKRRFPVVALTLRLSLLRAHTVVIATSILHNICRLNNLDDDIASEVEVAISDMEEAMPASNNNEIDMERNMLIEEYFSQLE
ncbi:hypothetical protein K1T71_014764 [Dendrolimus kikuchii]|nr:hypothetical protein K1T71_014764 [Dendrolimus kikuchii]